MRLGSLFDGIGAFPLVAIIHGIEPVWASEIEKFPTAVTSKHFPQMKHLGDITKINGAEIEPVDIITAGTPCQNLSVAGKRAGLAGEQSSLFAHFIRIVREMRYATKNKFPRFILWENVPGAFSSNGGQDFRTVLEEIAETEIPMPESGKWADAGMVRGAGRSLAWRVLDARHFGVPQRRKRIFLVADFTGGSSPEILFESKGMLGHLAESGEAREEIARSIGDSVVAAGGVITFRDVAGTLRAGAGAPKHESDWEKLICSPISAKWAKGTGGPSGDECQNLVAFGPGGQHIAHALRAQPSKADKPSRTLDLNGGNPACNQGGIMIVENTLYENHRQDSRITGPLNIAPTVQQKYGTGGNNTPLVVRGFEGNIARTLTARQDSSPCADRRQDLVFAHPGTANTLLGKGNLSHRPDTDNIAVQNYFVRRLTVIECLRLMGFPDWWFDGVPGYSDTAGYKSCGNSIAVPCISWIMNNIKEVFEA